MTYWRLYYHLVWATKNREPLITPEIEGNLYGYLSRKAASHKATVYAINGDEQHIHVVASIPPSIAVSEFAKSLKGSSSHHLNHLPDSEGNFGWQRGYGVLSFGKKQLDFVVRYVQDQKRHHQEKTGVIPALERAEEPE